MDTNVCVKCGEKVRKVGDQGAVKLLCMNPQCRFDTKIYVPVEGGIMDPIDKVAPKYWQDLYDRERIEKAEAEVRGYKAEAQKVQERFEKAKAAAATPKRAGVEPLSGEHLLRFRPAIVPPGEFVDFNERAYRRMLLRKIVVADSSGASLRQVRIGIDNVFDSDIDHADSWQHFSVLHLPKHIWAEQGTDVSLLVHNHSASPATFGASAYGEVAARLVPPGDLGVIPESDHVGVYTPDGKKVREETARASKISQGIFVVVFPDEIAEGYEFLVAPTLSGIMASATFARDKRSVRIYLYSNDSGRPISVPFRLLSFKT